LESEDRLLLTQLIALIASLLKGLGLEGLLIQGTLLLTYLAPLVDHHNRAKSNHTATIASVSQI
jgi:hypothetical protein